MLHKKLLLAVAGAAWAATAGLAQTTTVSTRNLSFPALGLASTETARINLTNVATATSSGTAASCTGTASFVNAAGTTIGSASSFTIASGLTSSVSLPFASSGLTGVRGEIRALVQVTRSSSSPAPCALLISVQTLDSATGVTHAYLTASEDFPAGDPGHR